MTSDSKNAQLRLQLAAAEGNPLDFLQEVLRQASNTVLLLGNKLEAEKKKNQALALELERRQQPPHPPSIHDAIRVLVQTYQTCGRCKSWKGYDRSQTDDLGCCNEAKHPNNRKNFLSTEDELETRSDFSCSLFTPRS